MMWNRQAGQAFILVLIILAIGALMVVPTLRLTGVTLENSREITQRNTGLYACAAAQEKIMWMLYHGDLMTQLGFDPAQGGSTSFDIDVCGTTVQCGVVMRALESVEGIILATEHTKLPSMLVSNDGVNFSGNITVPYSEYNVLKDYWFELDVEQVSSNTTENLEAMWHLIPARFTNITYIDATISIDGGEWVDLATYNPSYVAARLSNYIFQFPGTGNFGDDFGKMVPGQVNSIRYHITAKFQNPAAVGQELCNWSIIRVGDMFTLSGPQAVVIVIGSGGTYEPGCNTNGFFDTYKDSYPAVIPPLQETNVTYIIHISNLKNNTQKIDQVIDFLPPGFTYVQMLDGITLDDPVTDNETINGVTRWKLTWSPDESIAAGATVNMSFQAVALQGISGSYFNEVLVLPNTVPTMSELDVIDDEYNWELSLGQNYSWNSGTVIVPAYDTATGAEGENTTASMSVEPDGVVILSWNTN
ncbi:hypothetical protein ACFLTB_05675 [Chloroflexota bacterium]